MNGRSRQGGSRRERGSRGRGGRRAGRAQEPVQAGGVISAVVPFGPDPSRWAIKVERRTVAVLEQGQIEAIGLAPGVELTESVAARITEAAARGRALDDAKRLLTARGMSRGRLVDRLMQRGHERAAAEAAASEVARLGLLDERAYAAAVVRGLLENKPAGRAMLVGRLRQRRVTPEIAEEVVAAALEGVDQAEGAEELARRRLRTMPPTLPAEKVRSRLYGYLARRGFPPDVCAGAVRAATAERGKDEDGADTL